MANTIGRKIFSVLLMAGLLSLAACAKKDDTAVVRVATRSGVTSTDVTSGIPATCANGASATGKIYDPQYQNGVTDYRPTVVSFLSSILSEQYVGQISTSPYDKTGIDFLIHLKADASGVILKAESKLEMFFFDSMVGTADPQTGSLIQAYPVKFGAGTALAGQLRGNQFTVQFGDEYGQVTLTTTNISGEYTYGTVRYVNAKNANGGSATQGTLGNFVIRTCAIY